MRGVADFFEDAAAAFDRAGRGYVLREARDEDAVKSQGAGLPEHLTQRPARQATAARRRAYAVADVADIVVEYVPQGDSAEYPAVLDDPPG